MPDEDVARAVAIARHEVARGREERDVAAVDADRGVRRVSIADTAVDGSADQLRHPEVQVPQEDVGHAVVVAGHDARAVGVEDDVAPVRAQRATAVAQVAVAGRPCPRCHDADEFRGARRRLGHLPDRRCTQQEPCGDCGESLHMHYSIPPNEATLTRVSLVAPRSQSVGPASQTSCPAAARAPTPK